MIGRREFLAASALTMSGVFSKSIAAGSTVAENLPHDQFDKLAEAARTDLKAPGMAYGVVRDGSAALRRGLGVRELGGTEPVTPQTLFHMASLSKPFVATVIAQRVEQGRLHLSQRLTEVLPEFRIDDPRAGAITVENLLTHTSGLPDVQEFHWDKPEYDAAALQRYLDGLSHTRLLFAPGDGFNYSDIGFEVLARIIEVIDGVPFETAAERAIFAPLKMKRSTFLFPEAYRSQVATPHNVDSQGNVSPSPVFPYNRPHAGSSTLLSCVDDMLRWVKFNANGGVLEGTRIISPETTRRLLAPHPFEIKQERYPAGVKIALSWFVLSHGQQTLFLHPGSDLGFNAICMFSLANRCGLIASVNTRTDQGPGRLLEFAYAALDAGLFTTAG